MLDKLRQLHLEIIQNLDAIKDITALPEPDVGRLVATRLALTRASRARTLLLESSYDDLIARSSGTIKAAIGTLRAEGRANLLVSIQHIALWSLPEIASRWTEYCMASKTIQSAMRARVKREVDLIYPLLAHSETCSIRKKA
ncbi:hypothetical protein [Sphingobium sp. Ant17]|uniref:hypothetical protein n=1 Tax=Sphingobium sp. Ant17 TaxID=1461752 RepID=UPI001267A9BC|nr:hypothetical protein [Sphingobium sp. Ant17]